MHIYFSYSGLSQSQNHDDQWDNQQNYDTR